MSKIHIVDTATFEKSTWQFRSDGIVVVTIKKNVHIELQDSMAEERYLRREMARYLPMKLMIIPGEGASVSKEVRDYSNRPEAKSMIKAEAIVVNSLAHKIMANFITKFYKTPMPIKVFNDQDSALDWLINFDE